MTKVVSLHMHQEAAEQASHWIAVLDGGDVTKSDLDRFNAWYLESAENARAFHELASLWGDMDSLSELSHLMPLQQETKKQAAINWRMATGVFASLLLVLSAFVFIPGQIQQDIWQAGDAYSLQASTAIGESSVIQLPDNSSIQLNTGTSIRVDFNESFREIWLDSGEAHFEVAKNKQLPFIVHAGGGTVRAVGTAFNVRVANTGVEVLVTEGEVEVRPLANKPAQENVPEPRIKKASLVAGQQTSFAEDVAAIQELKPETIDRELAWQRGMLIFEGEPITEAIAEINRYTNRNIVISDPAINDIRVGGYFQVGEVDAMLDVFENSFGIEVTHASRGLIMLSGKDTIR